MTQNDAVNDLGEKKANGQEEPGNKMEELLNEEGLTIDFPKHGETRDGVIASITEGQILVSVGAKSEGLITGKEYEAIPPDILSTLTVGKSIPVFVITPEDQSGNLILSFVRAIEEQSWVDAEELLSNNASFSSTIVGYNKGGLLVPLGTIRGFIPASQVSFSRRVSITGDSPEEKYKEMVGDKVEVRIIEVDRERRRLILSERAASSETRDEIKDKVIDDLNEGDVRIGKVTSLADFGAFVSINGADGLVHLSEISWDRVN
ncbi:MAG: S1 RNA-binding domain-containing protein, partial [Anaerolineaceae bacterium]|nr:S1 RNA-binding domain-containing protein [Anaerolineaceae bacterium]